MSVWPPHSGTIERPAYRSLARHLMAAIEAGTLGPGDRLPTHRELAWQLGLSVQTVSRAYETLIRADMVSGEVGRGSFVRGPRSVPAPPYARLDDEERVVDCSMLTPAVGARHARLMQNTLREVAADLPEAALTSFRPGAALGPFTEAMTGWLALCGLTVPPRRVLPTHGATVAMTVALLTATSPGDRVVTECLGHHSLTTLMRHLGLRLTGLPVDEEGITPEGFAEACREAPVRALYVMPAGLSALARTMSRARRDAVVEIARRHDVLILENDAWGPLEPARPPPLSATAPERGFYFTGFSKCLLPGLRLGALVMPEPFVEPAASRHLATNWMATPLVAEIGRRWLRDGTAEELLGWQRRAMSRRNRIAAETLRGHDWHGNRRGLHVWLALPPDADDDAFVAKARGRGVAVASGAAFAIDAREARPKGVRICLGGPSEADLRLALRQLSEIADGFAAALRPAPAHERRRSLKGPGVDDCNDLIS